MINRVAIFIFRLLLYPVIFFKRHFRRLPYSDKVNFLVVNTTGIGDTILSTPAWQILRERFPGAFISVMVHERRKDIVAYNPIIDNIVIYRKFVYFFRIIKQLRKLKIDIAFILHGNDPDILPIVFLGGAREIIGYPRRTKLPYILTIQVPGPPRHFIMAQVKLVEAFNRGPEIDAGDTPFPIFPLRESERKDARIFIEKNSLIGKSIIGVLPGAGKVYKQWPPERFAAVISHFLDKYSNTVIVIMGSEKEIGLAEKIKQSISYENNNRVFIVCGSLGLREAGAIMENMDFFITNDSGPLHIAVALGVPTVAIFCPTDPEGLLPIRALNLKVVKKPPLCIPCITKRCKEPSCMEQISIEEVIDAAEELYADITQ